MSALEDKHQDPPPFSGSWNRLYVAIVIYTCALIVVLYLMTIMLNH